MQNKVCAKCGAAVAADAKFCTTCGSSEFAAAPAKKPFPTWAKVLIIIGIIIFVPVACTVACTGLLFGAVEEGINEVNEAIENGDYDIDVNYGESDSSTSTVLDTEYVPGETFENGSLKLDFTEVNKDFKDYSQYMGPDSGYKVIQYKFTAKNIGSSDIFISSYSFDCYSDDVVQEDFLWANDSSKTSGGTISAGKTAYINVYCEVPIDSVKNTVEYDFSWLDDNIVFNAN